MNKPNPKKKATLADTQHALHEMMVQDGIAFPETPEDIDRIEAEIDDSRLPTPDVNSFMKFLRGEPTEPPLQASKILPFQSAAHANDLNDLAMAARNGGPIDPETRKRMDEHRAASEQKATDEKK
jgi:hypothetical protein